MDRYAIATEGVGIVSYILFVKFGGMIQKKITHFSAMSPAGGGRGWNLFSFEPCQFGAWFKIVRHRVTDSTEIYNPLTPFSKGELGKTSDGKSIMYCSYSVIKR